MTRTVTPTTAAHGPRETMRELPRFVQPLLTVLTGKPLSEETAWGLTHWHHLFESVGFLILGVVGSAVAVVTSDVALVCLPLTWLIALHGARKLRTVIMHQCAHSNFCRNKMFDRLLGKMISIVLTSEEFDNYKRSHCRDHHSSRHQTITDPTVAFLILELGLRPGMTPGEMWRRLLLTLLSPLYHFRFLVARFRSHFERTSWAHKFAFVTFVASAVTIATVLDGWLVFAIAWLVPIVILYQMSTAFRLASKHVFAKKLPEKRNRATLGMFTVGIFIGTPCPLGLRRWGARWWANWTWWWACMAFYHLPCRLAVLVGDGPAHDYHHRHPNCPSWPDYLHNRQKDATSEENGPPYKEVWGLHQAIQACFVSLAEADPADYQLGTAVDRTYALLAADD